MKKVFLFLISLSCISFSTDADAFRKKKKSILVGMKAKSDSKANGTVRIREKDESLYIEGRIKKLEPGEYSIHVHENPDCSDSSATKAGPIFKSLGKITANEEGTAEFQFIRPDLCKTEGESCSVVDRSLVVSKSKGESRLVCGVIDRKR